jgi:hypothetical protein
MSEKTFEVREVFKRTETLEGSKAAEPSRVQHLKGPLTLKVLRREV